MAQRTGTNAWLAVVLLASNMASPGEGFLLGPGILPAARLPRSGSWPRSAGPCRMAPQPPGHHRPHSNATLSRRAAVCSGALIPAAAMILAAPPPASAAKSKKDSKGGPAVPKPFVAGAKVPLVPVLGTCCPCPVGGSAEFSDEVEGGGGDGDGVCGATFSQVLLGIESGYRWIDTASHYNNERSVGEAIRAAEEQGLVGKGEVSVITKVWFDDLGYKATLAACEASLQRLGQPSLGAVLVHFPGTIDTVQSPAKNKKLRAETWRALEELRGKGKIRFIGVSNYVRRHLKELLASCEVPPDLAEMEIHPFFQQQELVQLCKEQGIQVMGFSPFAHGDLPVLKDKTIARIAAKHGRTPAQIILKFLIQDGVVPIVKASSKERMAEDADVGGFALAEEDLAALRLLDANKRVGLDPNQIA